MQQRNIILFVVVAGLILLGSTYLQNKFWPPPPPQRPEAPTEGPVVVLPERSLWGSLPAQVAAAVGQLPAVPGIGSAGTVATQLAVAHWAGGPVERANAAAKPPVKVEKPVASRPQAPHLEGITLGDDRRFNLKVSLTTLGAGVQQVVLNRFQEADAEGRPVWSDEKQHKKQPLALIPNDPAHPSYLFYHYANPEEAHPEGPLDLLGNIDWAVRSKAIGPNDDIHEVAFVAQVPEQELTVTKTFRLAPGDYHLGLTLTLERSPSAKGPAKFRYQLAGAHGLPVEGQWYTNVWRNALIGRVDAGGAATRDLETSQQIAYHGGGEEFRGDERRIQYAGIATQYFASMIVVSDRQEEGIDGRQLLAWVRPTLESEPDPRKPQLADVTVRGVSEAVELKPGERIAHEYLLYNGPVKVRLLGQLEEEKAGPGGGRPERAPVPPALVERYENVLHLNTMTDYGRFGIWSSLIIRCTNLMHSLLEFLHNWIMPWSYGLCIILLTILVRGAMFPLSRKQAISSAKMQAKMAELQPEFKKLEERYKGDPMGLHQAKNELMLKRGIHPLTMMGSCWVVFLQMPIFLGLYYALQESIYFRLAPFLWIQNLSAPDMLLRWGEGIPFISGALGPYFNVLPLIAVSLMVVQQKMLAPPPTDEQQAMQQKTMQIMMLVFGFMFYKVAAGLCIYFIASSLWGLTERKLLPSAKRIDAAPAASTVPGPGRGRVGRVADRNGNGKMQKVRDLWERVLKEARKK